MSGKDRKDRQFKGLGSQESQEKAQQLEVRMGSRRVCKTAGSPRALPVRSFRRQRRVGAGAQLEWGEWHPALTPPSQGQGVGCCPQEIPYLHC